MTMGTEFSKKFYKKALIAVMIFNMICKIYTGGITKLGVRGGQNFIKNKGEVASKVILQYLQRTTF
jgi:hypothetical protein